MKKTFWLAPTILILAMTVLVATPAWWTPSAGQTSAQISVQALDGMERALLQGLSQAPLGGPGLIDVQAAPAGFTTLHRNFEVSTEDVVISVQNLGTTQIDLRNSVNGNTFSVGPGQSGSFHENIGQVAWQWRQPDGAACKFLWVVRHQP